MSEQTFADGCLRLTMGRVAVIELNAPARRNAVNQAMWAALPHVCAAISGDDGVRAVILRGVAGAGGPVFCAGADIAEFAEVCATPERAAGYNAHVRAAQQALRDLPRPVIAEVAGPCVGGGCGLALSCDLRFASQAAVFGITPARLGIGYPVEDTAVLVQTVGPARARDILFSARLLPAAEALAIGLVDRVLAADALQAAVADYAGHLATLSPESIRVAKAVINRVAEGAATDMDDLRARVAATFSGRDFAEGRAAFLGRRPPGF